MRAPVARGHGPKIRTPLIPLPVMRGGRPASVVLLLFSCRLVSLFLQLLFGVLFDLVEGGLHKPLHDLFRDDRLQNSRDQRVDLIDRDLQLFGAGLVFLLGVVYGSGGGLGQLAADVEVIPYETRDGG